MSDDHILDAAAAWHAGQDADDMDWPGFESWLESDPRHRAAFDAVALLDQDIGRHREALRRLLPEPEPVAPRTGSWRRPLIGGGAVAAAAAAAVLVVATQQTPRADAPSSPITYAAGTTARDVQVAAAQVILAPGSSITTAGSGGARIGLAGRAIFSVVHDPSRTLAIRAQGFEIRDVGTRFEIVEGGGAVRVSVAEGEVEMRRADGSGAATRIAAGRTATGLADGRIVTGATGRSALDGWRTGPLVYDAMPMGLVAADVARASGRTVVADPDVAAQSFSGVLATGQGEAMVQTLATLAGLEARRQGDTIHLGHRVRR